MDNTVLILTVSDDGVGFDPEMLSDSDVLGLTGMRERAGLIGGVLTIQSQPGKGATVRLEAPLTGKVSG